MKHSNVINVFIVKPSSQRKFDTWNIERSLVLVLIQPYLWVKITAATTPTESNKLKEKWKCFAIDFQRLISSSSQLINPEKFKLFY